MARTTGRALPLRQNTASAKPPTSAPLVRPRSENAVFKTNSTCRLKYATKTSTAAQATVEVLLNARKKDSVRPCNTGLTKSIVETEANEVRAELTEDIAAARIATMRKPLSRCGASVSMKIGKIKSF